MYNTHRLVWNCKIYRYVFSHSFSKYSTIYNEIAVHLDFARYDWASNNTEESAKISLRDWLHHPGQHGPCKYFLSKMNRFAVRRSLWLSLFLGSSSLYMSKINRFAVRRSLWLSLFLGSISFRNDWWNCVCKLLEQCESVQTISVSTFHEDSQLIWNECHSNTFIFKILKTTLTP